MLRSISIKRFKSINEIDLDLGRINLFIGANGAGKSNILEAIGLASAALGRDVSHTELQKKGIRLSRAAIFKAAFKKKKLPITFSIDCRLDHGISYNAELSAGEISESLNFHSESMYFDSDRVFGRSPRGSRFSGQPISKSLLDPTRSIWDQFKASAKASKDRIEELNRFSRYSIYAPQTSFLRGVDTEFLPIAPLGLSGGNLAKAAQAVLRLHHDLKGDARRASEEILDLVWAPGWTDQIEITSINPELVSREVKASDVTIYFRDKFMKETRNLLSAYDSSEGTLYLLFASVLLLHPEAPKIFALDNVDNALNPNITRRLLETIIKGLCGGAGSGARHTGGAEQVFLTSHNPTALDAFDIFDDDQRIFVVSREKDRGFTTVERLLPKAGLSREEWQAMVKGKFLSELWIEGRIKGALSI